ncbi:MAG: Mth938-like domain-containing protein [Steroidobacteraceae bacterium]
MTISRTGVIVPSMKLTLEASSRVNLIRAYSSQEIRIGEQRLHASCIVTADTVISQWQPARFSELTPAHLEPILALKPELVLLGTGATQRFPPAPIRSALTERGVGLEVMDLGAACRTFNILVQEERRVAAALFLS